MHVPEKRNVVMNNQLSELIQKMDERSQRLFACDCAERVLYLFETARSDDKRPRNAIETARRYVNGQATRDELEKSSRKAEMAAWDAGAEEREDSPPEVQAIASVAVTAEMVARYPDDSYQSITATIDMVSEVIMVANLGAEVADKIWQSEEHWNHIDSELAMQARATLDAELDWQTRQAKTYINSNQIS